MKQKHIGYLSDLNISEIHQKYIRNEAETYRESLTFKYLRNPKYIRNEAETYRESLTFKYLRNPKIYQK